MSILMCFQAKSLTFSLKKSSQNHRNVDKMIGGTELKIFEEAKGQSFFYSTPPGGQS